VSEVSLFLLLLQISRFSPVHTSISGIAPAKRLLRNLSWKLFFIYWFPLWMHSCMLLYTAYSPIGVNLCLNKKPFYFTWIRTTRCNCTQCDKTAGDESCSDHVSVCMNSTFNITLFIIPYCIITFSLRRADRSSRGVLPTVVCRCVWSRNSKNEETMAHWVLLRQVNKQTKKIYPLHEFSDAWQKLNIMNLAILHFFHQARDVFHIKNLMFSVIL